MAIKTTAKKMVKKGRSVVSAPNQQGKKARV
jgi:hypothetical protein